MSYEEPRHPINFVSKRTGLTTHVIRVWERRYGAIQPHRSETNRRLYSDAEVDRLKLLSQVKAQGQAIRLIAPLSNDELKSLLIRVSDLAAVGDVSHRSSENQEPLKELLAKCQDAVLKMDDQGLARVLLDASVQLPLLPLLDGLVGPFMTWMGNRWHAGSIRVAHEHMATAQVRSFLGRMKEVRPISDGVPCIVVATPAGQDHEIGALMASAIASNDGWRDLYLGPSLPAQDIALAAMESDARAVAVSIVAPGNNPAVIHEFRLLRNLLEERIPILAGGGGVRESRHHYEMPGVDCVDNLAEFQAQLAHISRQ